MSGKKHCKGVDVVSLFGVANAADHHREGWMAGFDVQLRFSGQGEKLGLHAQAVQAHGRVGEVSGGGGRGEEV